MDTEISAQIRDYLEAAAPTIQLAELADRRVAGQPSRRVHGPGWAPPRRAVAAAAAAVVLAAGAVAMGVTVSGGSPPRSAAHRVSAIHLTVAMVHRVQRASTAALASAGHVLVTYTIPQPAGTGAYPPGTIDFRFSGHNFSSVAEPPTRGGRQLKLTTRSVNGQIYILAAYGRPRQWYHLANGTGPGRAYPDPRTLLQALQPGAGFEAIGSQLIGGVPTTHLRATELRNLPASLISSLAFIAFMGPTTLAALNVWVDSHDVVRQMQVTFSVRSPQGRLVETQTVRFLDIGKPETITAPAHYVNLGTRR
jgi:hypothetical protein